ncbi:MAG: asparagine synthase (glutamine-hydrolyzing) [bacterium]
MCGINGLLNYSGISIPEAEKHIGTMNQAISHRGPDDSGIWSAPCRGVFLGHQRLSILDLSASGHQPMRSPQGTVLVYNGEIYNFKALKAACGARRFFSQTDTEVLLYLYEREGRSCLHHLNGMFAFALWDEAKAELFLARDRIGIKPLYYTTRQGVFAFSSEIKALLTLPWVTAELDEEALYHFLTFNYVLPPQTMFKGIYKFHPAHMMVVGKSGIRAYEPYWQISYRDYSSLSEDELGERIIFELERAVQYHMISDVPVGVFLSGGVDSSAITALMQKRPSTPIKTYSVGFQNAPAFDELSHARKISQRLGTEHHEKIVTVQDVAEFLPRVIEIYDEPLADAASIPIYFMAQRARENGTTVVLTGDGGDELFCGYRQWMRYVQIYPLYRLFSKLPRSLKSGIARLYGFVDNGSPQYEIFSRATKGQEFFWGSGGFKESTKRFFLTPAFRQRLSTSNSYDQVAYFHNSFQSIRQKDRPPSDVDWLCYLGVKAIIPNLYLYRADRLGMAHAIELRVPYLDHEFVNLALSIPAKWKTLHREPKYILKKSLEKLLPTDVLYRKKMGFCVPLREWAGEFMVDYLDANLSRFCRETGIFDENGLRQLLQHTRAGNTQYIFALWNIYFLMAWFRKWLL